MQFTIQFKRVTESDRTFVELVTELSSDADATVLADARYKQQDHLAALHEALLVKKSFHKGEVKDYKVLLDSAEGQKRLQESIAAGNSQHAVMAPNFCKQIRDTFCGVASSVTVLRTLFSKPYNEGEMFPVPTTIERNHTLTMDRVVKEGMTLEEVATLLRAYGASATPHHADKITLDECRTLLSEALREKANTHVIANVHMGQLGYDWDVGHLSPISAYHKASDSFLILDVWPKFAFAWFPASVVYAAMNTFDKDANAHRGFVIAKPT